VHETVEGQAVTHRHPLEPLTADEVRAVREILDGAGLLPPAVVVNTVTLDEPTKAELADWPAHGPARRAEVVLVDRATGRGARSIVDLTARAVVATESLGDRQPSLSQRDQIKAIQLTREHTGWQAAIRARGISDLDRVQLDPWPTGDFVAPEHRGRRLVRCIAFDRPHPTANGYARPISGVISIVDVNAGEVVAVEDHGVVPFPPEDGDYATAPGERPSRTDLRRLEITQPDGPSFEVDGHHVRWQRWDLRLSLHPIEGLVLHQVGYADDGQRRSILHRASLAEMVVPYGDPEATFYWRNAFDAGEVGMGKSVNSLTLGCDCVGEIRYFDAVTVDHTGEPVVHANAVCMHEEDYGTLWKHTDIYTGDVQVRRSRRLVVSAFYTLGNYEYGCFWYFYLDGSIQLEMKLTGIVATKAIGPGEVPAHAVEIAPRLVAPHHQHLFCFRLDVDLDGVENTVHEVDVVPADDDPVTNPFGNAFDVVRTPIASEAEGGRRIDASRARTWHVVNEGRRNRLGAPVGYKLEPHGSALLLAGEGSSIRRRAGFATNHLWVTRFDPSQRRPGGEFPNQSTGDDDGLSAWVAADRSLTDTDVVLWHVFGPTHIARPEDWPVMPVEYAGFWLKPVGFFERNPALDVPPPQAAGDCCHA
jgi:primary-amine oxidase